MKIESTILSKVKQELQPIYLSVLNESGNHNVPPNSETHFNVTIVSDAFNNLRQVQQHQLVYKVLAEELEGPVHALALHTYKPSEWLDEDQAPSPECMGGDK